MSLSFMTRKATIRQLYNHIEDKYEMKIAVDIESALLDLFDNFIQ